MNSAKNERIFKVSENSYFWFFEFRKILELIFCVTFNLWHQFGPTVSTRNVQSHRNKVFYVQHFFAV